MQKRLLIISLSSGTNTDLRADIVTRNMSPVPLLLYTISMRRTEREVTSIESIFDILSRSTVVRIAMNDEKHPYVIPMTFGPEYVDGKIIIYFHSALEGHKNDLLRKDENVTVEADLYYRTEETGIGITAKYESVIGTGKAERLTETKDKVHGLKIILDHYSRSGFPVESCKGLSKCDVFRITLDTVTGKHNID